MFKLAYRHLPSSSYLTPVAGMCWVAPAREPGWGGAPRPHRHGTVTARPSRRSITGSPAIITRPEMMLLLLLTTVLEQGVERGRGGGSTGWTITANAGRVADRCSRRTALHRKSARIGRTPSAAVIVGRM